MICIGKQGFFEVSGEIKRKIRVNEKTGLSGTRALSANPQKT
jgi:hypothetical protein